MKRDQIISRIEKLFPSKVLLDNDQTAELLGWKPATLNILRSKGLGPVYSKTGGRVRYLIDDIADYIFDSSRRTA